MQAEELDFMQKKTAHFDTATAQQLTDRMIQKITKQFAGTPQRGSRPTRRECGPD